MADVRTSFSTSVVGLIFLATWVLVSSACANDSTAELATGGLVFTKSADVEMRSENLFVSMQEIRVRYRLFNRSNADITSLVAFPMPDIDFSQPDAKFAIPSDDPRNFLDFHTSTDGRPVEVRLEQKAFAAGIDITERLRHLKIPLAPQSSAANNALDALSKADQDALVAATIAIANDFDVGKGWEHHLEPAWKLTSTYIWSQTFPAGREILVDHSYKPSVGSSILTTMGDVELEKDDLPSYREKYCVDASFLAAARLLQRKKAVGGESVLLGERRISYILKTGANWRGPIGDFHLVVDKGAPDALVSFCADGVKKIGPTRFEVRYTNFTPNRDLNVLILSRTKH